MESIPKCVSANIKIRRGCDDSSHGSVSMNLFKDMYETCLAALIKK